MKTAVILGAAFLAVGLAAEPAAAQGQPGGCLKYGLGGAVAGHFAGGHRLKGALAGCVLGMARRRQYEREVQERRRNEQIARERSRDPGRTAERNPAPQPRIDRNPDSNRLPETQRTERFPAPFPDRVPEAQRADRIPGPLPEARPRPDRRPDWLPDAQRADRTPAPEPRSPYEDLGLGRSVPRCRGGGGPTS